MDSASECTANIIGDTPIVHGDYIYFFDVKDGVEETSEGREFYIDTKLKRASLETSEIEEISEFTACEPREGGGFVLIGDTLYFCGDDMNPKKNEYGDIGYADIGGIHYFCSVNLENGEYKNYGSIYDDDKQYSGASTSSTARVKGYYNSKIYIQYSFMKEYVEPSEKPAHTDSRDIFTILNFEFDPTTGSLTQSDLPSASFMDDNTYLYSDYPENSSTLIYNGETHKFNGVDVKLAGRYFNNKLFMYDGWYDKADGSKHGLGEYEEWKVQAFYDDCYILADPSNKKAVKLTEEELRALE
ncbi:MAG: hypothetical protein J6B75_04720 [Ruminococcus sp.]|nr:hypothetical protein [Ruminococcus sp.]